MNTFVIYIDSKFLDGKYLGNIYRVTDKKKRKP